MVRLWVLVISIYIWVCILDTAADMVSLRHTLPRAHIHTVAVLDATTIDGIRGLTMAFTIRLFSDQDTQLQI